MHFPWKKSKVSRISRMVAGLHHSPKRGGSFVVATGFPTSIVDLFVKNRDRFRKSSKRKPSSSPQILKSPPSACNENLQPPDMDAGENDEERVLFHLVLKVSLMVALAVSTISVAIWIVMSALLLVIIEFPNTLFFYHKIRTGLNLKPRTDEPVVKQRGTEFADPCEPVELKDDVKNEMEAVTCKSERSPSSRIKTSLIKKFVPKKFRHGKRKKQGKSNNKGKEPSIQFEKEKEEQEHGVDEEDESGTGNVRKGNSGYVMILLVIILTGFIGGRGVALLLTLACCSTLISTCVGTRADKTSGGLNSGPKS